MRRMVMMAVIACLALPMKAQNQGPVRMLNEKQQKWIIQLFQRTGYTENLVFEHYAYVYDFSTF